VLLVRRGDLPMVFALGFYPGRVVTMASSASAPSSRGDPLTPTSQ